MSALAEIYIKREVAEVIAETLKKRDDKGVSITISINDETNDYDQNVSAYVSQSKEEREEKKKKFYVGNGKVFWTDGKITVATKAKAASSVDDGKKDDLPF